MNKRDSSAVKPLPHPSGARIERGFTGTTAQFDARTNNFNQMPSERSLARIHFKKLRFATLAVALLLPSVIRAGDDGTSDFAVLRRPVSKLEALNIAIARNGTILQTKKDIEAAMGIAIQTKAIVYPHVGEQAQYVASISASSRSAVPPG